MLARKRSAIADHKICRFFYELPIFADPLLRLQVKVDAGVNASMPEVSVESTAIAVAGHQRAKITQIMSQVFGRDRRIFPALPGQRLTRHVGNCAQTGFTHLPNFFCQLLVNEQVHVGWSRTTSEGFHQSASLRLRFLSRVGAKLHEQPASALWQERQPFRVDALPPRVLDQQIINAFEPDRFMRHDVGDTISALINVGIRYDEQNALRRTFNQTARCLKHGRTRSFGADQRPRYMETVFRQQIVQVISGNPARDVGIALSNKIAVLVNDGFELSVNFASVSALSNNSL